MIDKGECTYKECSDKKCSPVTMQKTQGKKILQMDHKRYTELQKTCMGINACPAKSPKKQQANDWPIIKIVAGLDNFIVNAW